MSETETNVVYETPVAEVAVEVPAKKQRKASVKKNVKMKDVKKPGKVGRPPVYDTECRKFFAKLVKDYNATQVHKMFTAKSGEWRVDANKEIDLAVATGKLKSAHNIELLKKQCKISLPTLNKISAEFGTSWKRGRPLYEVGDVAVA